MSYLDREQRSATGDVYVIIRRIEGYVRIPESCYSYDTKRLHGHAYRVASDEYNVCIESFVRDKNSLEYIARLKERFLATCRRSVETFAETVTVHEHHCRRKDRDSAPSQRRAA